MKAKLLLIFLILVSFLVIGCVDETEEVSEENTSLNGSVEETVNETPAEDSYTNETQEDEISDGEDEGVKVVESEEPRTYTIYMENFLTQPSNITINTGDTVVWFNRNDPTRVFTLVSNEGLWENKNIGKRLTFKYTFNETGTYTYKVLGFEERMKGTIIVK